MAVFTGAHIQFPHRNATYDILSEKKTTRNHNLYVQKVCSCTQSSEKLQVYSRLKTTNTTSRAMVTLNYIDLQQCNDELPAKRN